MEELEQFKKQWNSDSELGKSYSPKELYGMLKSNTKSISKDLFIIGLIEIALWTAFYYLDGEFDYFRFFVFVVLLALVIYQYFKISNDTNTIALIKSIRKLRLIVLVYAVISILIIVIQSVITAKDNTKGLMAGFRDGRNGVDFQTAHAHMDEHIASMHPTFMNYVAYGVLALFFIFILVLIYDMAYGKILRKLNNNYKELLKSE